MVFRGDISCKAQGLPHSVVVSPVGMDVLLGLPCSNILRVFRPNTWCSLETGEAYSSCAWLLFPLSFPSYLSASFLSISLCPRLKWIMRSLITKTWPLSPRSSPSMRCNAPTSFPTSPIPDTRPTRCWRGVAMERYGVLALPRRLLEERRGQGSPVHSVRDTLASTLLTPKLL